MHHMSDWQPVLDVLRIIVFTLGCAALGVSGVVAFHYAAVYGRMRQAARTSGAEFHWRGLLPRHVAMIAAAHLMLLVATMVDIVVHFRYPGLRPVLGVYATAYVLTFAAQWTILGYSKRAHR